MIIVTGTKRSGTSMWMQILAAAGLPLFGEAFPRNWGDTLRQANPGGFYESMLRQGIYWRTNPHPRTGAYFFPEQVRQHAVKVFIPGLVRTDRAYIGHVIASVRPWREYCRSLRRLWAMEDAALAERHPGRKPLPRLSPALEWWSESYMLLRDVAIRRYPVHLQSYDGLLEDPKGVLERTFAWLGAGSASEALAAVKPERRTQQDPASAPAAHAGELDLDEAELDPAAVAVFDRLYRTVHRAEPVGAELLTALNATQAQLGPRVAEQQRAVYRAHQRRRARAQQDGEGTDEDALLDDPDLDPDRDPGQPTW